MTKISTLAKPVLANKSEAALRFAEGRQSKPEVAATTRLNANIKVELHRALKMRAAAERTTIGNLIEEWIKGWAK